MSRAIDVGYRYIPKRDVERWRVLAMKIPRSPVRPANISSRDAPNPERINFKHRLFARLLTWV